MVHPLQKERFHPAPRMMAACTRYSLNGFDAPPKPRYDPHTRHYYDWVSHYGILLGRRKYVADGRDDEIDIFGTDYPELAPRDVQEFKTLRAFVMAREVLEQARRHLNNFSPKECGLDSWYATDVVGAMLVVEHPDWRALEDEAKAKGATFRRRLISESSLYMMELMAR